MAYTKYSLTPANNTAAPPDGAPEGMLPSAVNDTMRDMMAQIRDVGDGVRDGTYTMTAVKITGGTINGATIGATSATTGKFSTLTNSALTSGRVTYAGTAGVLQDSAALTFDGSNIVVNSTTPAYFTGTSNLAQISINRSPSTGAIFNASQSAAFINIDGVSGGSSIQFATATANNTQPTERMRLDSSGNLLVGTTTPTNSPFSSTSKFVVSGDFTGGFGQSITDTNTNTAVDHYLVSFNLGTASGNQKGYINFVGASGLVLYSTTSDQRLKTDLGVVTETSVIDNLLIHDYTWKESGVAGRGVFAQEAYEIIPNAIGKGKDAKDGSINIPWGVDYSKFVPDLIIHAQQLKKQVQQQQALIESLTTRLTALESK